MTLKTKIISSIAMFAFVLAIFAPSGAYAATTITIKGNGADSYNKVKLTKAEKKKARKERRAKRLAQKNKNKLMNMISISQKTGKNSTNKNTGDGNVDLTSGDATATVKVTNKTTGNTADGNDCGCEGDSNDLTIKIKKNGADSTNMVKVSYGGDGNGGNGVSQSNHSYIMNGVMLSQSTGQNSANKNTGDGAVDLTSGDAEASITISNTTGGNEYNTIN